ncbi:hypothetical protein K437DRAFT_295829, partial [Tilletiaria anomala UBC 951]
MMAGHSCSPRSTGRVIQSHGVHARKEDDGCQDASGKCKQRAAAQNDGKEPAQKRKSGWGEKRSTGANGCGDDAQDGSGKGAEADGKDGKDFEQPPIKPKETKLEGCSVQSVDAAKKTDQLAADSLDDIQRTHVILRPLENKVYPTRNLRSLQVKSLSICGKTSEARWETVAEDTGLPSVREVRLSYHLSHKAPAEFGDAQRAIGLDALCASILLQVRNPTLLPSGPEAPPDGLPWEGRAELSDEQMKGTFGGAYVEDGAEGKRTSGNRYSRPERMGLLDWISVELLMVKRNQERAEQNEVAAAGEQRKAQRCTARKDADMDDENALKELATSAEDFPVDVLSGNWLGHRISLASGSGSCVASKRDASRPDFRVSRTGSWPAPTEDAAAHGARPAGRIGRRLISVSHFNACTQPPPVPPSLHIPPPRRKVPQRPSPSAERTRIGQGWEPARTERWAGHKVEQC